MVVGEGGSQGGSSNEGGVNAEDMSAKEETDRLQYLAGWTSEEGYRRARALGQPVNATTRTEERRGSMVFARVEDAVVQTRATSTMAAGIRD